MFTKTNIVSTIVCAIWAFAGGYLLWGVIGDPYLQGHLGSATGVMKEIPNMGVLAVGCLIVAFVISTVYSKWSHNHHSISAGAKFGIWIGILLGFGSGIIDHATSNILDMTGALVNGLIYVIHFAVIGALAGLVYSKMAAKAS